ncbi:MAG: ribonuclease III [Clostridia bacterium]|nr:ribonuclease III [Clostridia bacterium]
MLEQMQNHNCNPKLLSPLTLAFIGDGVYGMLVRERLVLINRPVGALHKKSVELVNAHAQSLAIQKIMDMLTEDEIAIYKRGRNANSVRHPKNSDLTEYRMATGLEALFGYLYLSNNQTRLYELFNMIFTEE